MEKLLSDYEYDGFSLSYQKRISFLSTDNIFPRVWHYNFRVKSVAKNQFINNFSIQKPHTTGHTVQVVQYADKHPTTSLKSLKDVNSLVDNISLTSNRLEQTI